MNLLVVNLTSWYGVVNGHFLPPPFQPTLRRAVILRPYKSSGTSLGKRTGSCTVSLSFLPYIYLSRFVSFSSLSSSLFLFPFLFLYSSFLVSFHFSSSFHLFTPFLFFRTFPFLFVSILWYLSSLRPSYISLSCKLRCVDRCLFFTCFWALDQCRRSCAFGHLSLCSLTNYDFHALNSLQPFSRGWNYPLMSVILPWFVFCLYFVCLLPGLWKQCSFIVSTHEVSCGFLVTKFIVLMNVDDYWLHAPYTSKLRGVCSYRQLYLLTSKLTQWGTFSLRT